MVRRSSGELLLAYSGGREEHIDPFGRVDLMRSRNGGRSWSTPETTGVWGLPSHLLKLADDRLLMSYDHRRKPYGNQARVSTDNGLSWCAPTMISSDGITPDLGYPSTVQFDDGSLLTVWYERVAGSARAVLRQSTWHIT